MTQKKRGLGFNPLLSVDQSTVDAVLNKDSSDTKRGTIKECWGHH